MTRLSPGGGRSRLLAEPGHRVRTILGSQSAAVTLHGRCLRPAAFRAGALARDFSLVATGRDGAGGPFVSVIEHKRSVTSDFQILNIRDKLSKVISKEATSKNYITTEMVISYCTMSHLPRINLLHVDISKFVLIYCVYFPPFNGFASSIYVRASSARLRQCEEAGGPH